MESLAEQLCVCIAGGDAIVRVPRRCTMHNSCTLQSLMHSLAGRGLRVTIDLGVCDYIDSTYMGCLALIGKDFRVRTGTLVTLVGVNQRVCKTITTVGLPRLFAVAEAVASPERVFQPVPETGVPLRQEDLLVAHKALVEISPENQQQFGNLIEVLTASQQGGAHPSEGALPGKGDQ